MSILHFSLPMAAVFKATLEPGFDGIDSVGWINASVGTLEPSILHGEQIERLLQQRTAPNQVSIALASTGLPQTFFHAMRWRGGLADIDVTFLAADATFIAGPVFSTWTWSPGEQYIETFQTFEVEIT